MGSEKNLWKYLKGKLKAGGGHIMRVENHILVGTPDINGCIQGVEFWIELKQRNVWPRKFKTFGWTIEQQRWMANRIDAGGKAFLLVQGGSDYMLFDGVNIAFRNVNECPQLEMMGLGAFWSGSIDPTELAICLTR